MDTEHSYSCFAEFDNEIIGKAPFHHCSFRSEKNQRTGDKIIILMKKVHCQPSPFSNPQKRERPVHELSSCPISREIENERIRILVEKEQILVEFRTEIQKHEFQAECDRRIIQELTGIIVILSEGKLIIQSQVMNNFDKIN